MATETYKASDRGMLVTVAGTDSIRVFSKPGTVTTEFIDGPATVGTATGKIFVDNLIDYTEVVRVGPAVGFGVPVVSTIYLLTEFVILKPNPAYDASKDTGRPSEAGTTATTADSSSGKVSTTPGEGRVPVVGSDGKTVYVLVDEDRIISERDPTVDKTKKWLTVGLYVVIGLAVVSLLTVVVISLSKPKKPVLA